MQLSPEVKAQLAEQKKQCVFCKLISGEMKGKTVFEDSNTTAMLDIYPVTKGHTLFMSKEHYPIMPYISDNDFRHLFGLLPSLTKGIKEGCVNTGINIFIANGGVAGQQASHFLMHLIPRDEHDDFFNFYLKKTAVVSEAEKRLLLSNFPLFMDNHFKSHKAPWHTGAGVKPSFLQEISKYGTVMYEDEKLMCILPEKGAASGQIDIYPKAESSDISKLSTEDCIHLFYTASSVASILFEGLKAQGTNIILKSGFTNDNPDGRLVVIVLPRRQDDALQELVWKQKQASYNLDNVAGKIKDKTWKVKYAESKSVDAIGIVQKDKGKIEARVGGKTKEMVERTGSKEKSSPVDEIRQAMEKLR